MIDLTTDLLIVLGIILIVLGMIVLFGGIVTCHHRDKDMEDKSNELSHKR
jgi:uncharacterized membrane protein